MMIAPHPEGVSITAPWLASPVVGSWHNAYWEAVRLRK